MLDLDTVAWEPDQIAVARPMTEACADVRAFCRSHDNWIIEGCYGALIEVGLEFSPYLVILDPGVACCVSKCLARPWEPHKYASKQDQDEKLSFLIDWVEDYYSRDDDMSLQAHKKLFDRYSGPKQWLSILPPLGFTLGESIQLVDIPT